MHHQVYKVEYVDRESVAYCGVWSTKVLPRKLSDFKKKGIFLPITYVCAAKDTGINHVSCSRGSCPINLCANV